MLNPNTTLDAFEIEPINLTAKQKKVMKYKSTIIEAWEGTYKITTTKALMRVALECGLGAKNGQGFGMIKLKHSR